MEKMARALSLGGSELKLYFPKATGCYIYPCSKNTLHTHCVFDGLAGCQLSKSAPTLKELKANV